MMIFGTLGYTWEDAFQMVFSDDCATENIVCKPFPEEACFDNGIVYQCQTSKRCSSCISVNSLTKHRSNITPPPLNIAHLL